MYTYQRQGAEAMDRVYIEQDEEAAGKMLSRGVWEERRYPVRDEECEEEPQKWVRDSMDFFEIALEDEFSRDLVVDIIQWFKSRDVQWFRWLHLLDAASRKTAAMCVAWYMGQSGFRLVVDAAVRDGWFGDVVEVCSPELVSWDSLRYLTRAIVRWGGTLELERYFEGSALREMDYMMAESPGMFATGKRILALAGLFPARGSCCVGGHVSRDLACAEACGRKAMEVLESKGNMCSDTAALTVRMCA